MTNLVTSNTKFQDNFTAAQNQLSRNVTGLCFNLSGYNFVFLLKPNMNLRISRKQKISAI